MTEQEDENLEAMDKLYAEKETMDEQDQNRYRYYEDLYNNQYRWSTHKQDDGKFTATYLKYYSSRGWGHLKVMKVRSFVKRRTAKAWCLKQVRKAKAHQKIVLDARAKRKQQRRDAKPKYTKSETAIQESKKQIEHYNKLIAKADTKIKTANTRKRTYLKRIKYYQRRIEKQQIETLI